MLLFMKRIEFPVQKNDFSKIKIKNKVCINVSCYENNYPTHILDQKFEYSMDLLLISDHYVYIKDFDRFMFSKRKNKKKIIFAKVVYSVLVVKMY